MKPHFPTLPLPPLPIVSGPLPISTFSQVEKRLLLFSADKSWHTNMRKKYTFTGIASNVNFFISASFCFIFSALVYKGFRGVAKIKANYFFHTHMCHLFMEFTFVQSQDHSRQKCPVTVITRNRYSFQMVGLIVISYMTQFAFLATHFANR